MTELDEEVKEKELGPEEDPEAEEPVPETDGQPEEAPEGKKKGSRFGKEKKDKGLEKVRKDLEESEKKAAELTDRLQRSMAEFDNFRKRTEKEKAAMFEIGARSVLEKLLPVVDSFERGLGGLSEEQKKDGFAAGMDLVYRQLGKMLEELDVKPIEAVGKPFDPEKHNAVMHVEDEALGENVVAEEFMKGYTYRGTVIRYSMVKVAN